MKKFFKTTVSPKKLGPRRGYAAAKLSQHSRAIFRNTAHSENQVPAGVLLLPYFSMVQHNIAHYAASSENQVPAGVCYNQRFIPLADYITVYSAYSVNQVPAGV